MTSRLDRLTLVMRWAVIAWVAYCAIQMVRWWRFDVPAMVVGWFWIGSFWGCLLCFIRRSRFQSKDWGARIALFVPTVPVACLFFRKTWIELGFDVAPAWLWPTWSLVFDLALLTWGWEHTKLRLWPLRLISTVTGTLGIAAVFAIPNAYPVVSVGGFVSLAIVLLRKKKESIRPHGLTLGVMLLAVVDLLLLVSIAFERDQADNLGLLALARMGIQTLVSWRISRPHCVGMDQVPASGSGWLLFMPMRAIRTVVWCGVIAWTCFVCWLYPRCVATGFGLNGHQSYSIDSKQDPPNFPSRYKVLANIWLASQQVHTVLKIHRDHLPEHVFAIQEVRHVILYRDAADQTPKSLSRFPHLESVSIQDVSTVTESVMKSLSAIPNLKALSVKGRELSLSFSDFSCFSAHPQLLMVIHAKTVRTNSENKSRTMEGIQALSNFESLDLSVESTCDEELLRQLCEIGSLRKLELQDIQGITGPTLNRLVGLQSLAELECVIRGIGESISLAEIAETANQMPIFTALQLVFPDVPLMEHDLLALERLGEICVAHKTRRSFASRENPLLIVSAQLTIDGDDALQRICALQSFRNVNAKVRGVSVEGLRGLLDYSRTLSWWLWSFSFDLTDLKCPAREWTELIQDIRPTQVVISPDSIQTEEDVAGLRILQGASSKIGTRRRFGVHVVCDPPTVDMLERLKQYAFSGQLIVNLTDQELTNEELFRIIEAIPTSEFDVDLRLPRTTHFTGKEAVRLRVLSQIEMLRLEIQLSDSAIPELAKLPGLYDLDLRDSELSPQGIEWLSHCKSFESLRVNPGSHLPILLKIAQERSGELHHMSLVGAKSNAVHMEALKFTETDPENLRVTRTNEVVYLNLRERETGTASSKNRTVEIVPENATLKELVIDWSVRWPIHWPFGWQFQRPFEWPIRLPRPGKGRVD